ncbi:hypothetical protein Taro_025993 [Colocasia esculenta]|uniref:Uncharacterized protein n=1 Tax=Colocasia esculenta TaxID=4460 RepID=A0A843VI77_COLES|nr:hypothetical protein [Colocasia esculenta]
MRGRGIRMSMKVKKLVILMIGNEWSEEWGLVGRVEDEERELRMEQVDLEVVVGPQEVEGVVGGSFEALVEEYYLKEAAQYMSWSPPEGLNRLWGELYWESQWGFGCCFCWGFDLCFSWGFGLCCSWGFGWCFSWGVGLSWFPIFRWLTGARGKTLVREAELDRAENSGSGGGFREEASKGSARIEVWQDFLHASERRVVVQTSQQEAGDAPSPPLAQPRPQDTHGGVVPPLPPQATQGFDWIPQLVGGSRPEHWQVLLVARVPDAVAAYLPVFWWLTGARGKTLVCEAELDRAENSGSGGGFREEASKGSARIEVVRGRLSRFEELCISVVGLVLLLHFFSYPFEFRLVAPVPLLVRDRTVVESGLHHQQSNVLTCVALGSLRKEKPEREREGQRRLRWRGRAAAGGVGRGISHCRSRGKRSAAAAMVGLAAGTVGSIAVGGDRGGDVSSLLLFFYFLFFYFFRRWGLGLRGS